MASSNATNGTNGTNGARAAAKPALGKVLVIGGNGFLGHHVVKLLVADYSATVSVIDLRCGRNRVDGAAYHEADITDAAKMESLVGSIRPDVVVHTASPAAQASSRTSDALFQKVNVDGTRCVVEACQKAGVKALVYTSSASILSDNKSDLVNANETWPVIRGKAQTEFYSETKAQAEELVLLANRAAPYGLLTCAIRPAAMLGEGDTMLTAHLVDIYKQGRTSVQVGRNENLFDFTYVANAAHAHLLAAAALLATHAKTAAAAAAKGGVVVDVDERAVDGEAFLVTNGAPMYFWDFCRAVWAAYGSPLGTDHVWVLPRPLGIVLGFASEVFFAAINKPPTFNRQRIVYSSMTRYYDISKAKQRLGYKPIVPLQDGITKAVVWFKELEAKGEVKK